MSVLSVDDLKDIAKHEVQVLRQRGTLIPMSSPLTDCEDNLFTIAMSVSDYIDSDDDYTDEIYEYLIKEFPDYL